MARMLELRIAPRAEASQPILPHFLQHLPPLHIQTHLVRSATRRHPSRISETVRRSFYEDDIPFWADGPEHEALKFGSKTRLQRH